MEIKEGHQYYRRDGNITGKLIPSDYLGKGGWYDPKHGVAYLADGRRNRVFLAKEDIVAEASPEAVKAAEKEESAFRLPDFPGFPRFPDFPQYVVGPSVSYNVSAFTSLSRTDCRQAVKDKLLFELAKKLDAEGLLTTETTSDKMTLKITAIPPEKKEE